MARAAQTVHAFYDPENWRAVFREKGPYWDPYIGHRGLDVAAADREEIPLLRTGFVEAINHSSDLGYVALVRVSATEWDAYAHLHNPTAAGRTLYQGQVVGQAAMETDDHGSAWGGSHLHLTTGPSPSVWYGAADAIRDPAPVVRAVLGLPPEEIPPGETQNGRYEDMLLLHSNVWGDWLIIPGQTARKVGNENITNQLVAVGVLKRVEVSDGDWNSWIDELTWPGINLGAPEGSTQINPALAS